MCRMADTFTDASTYLISRLFTLDLTLLMPKGVLEGLIDSKPFLNNTTKTLLNYKITYSVYQTELQPAALFNTN